MHKRNSFRPASLKEFTDDLYADHPTPPADALVKLDDGTLEYRGASLSRVGLFIPRSFGTDDWEALGYVLGQFESSANWWLGDWIVYGLDLKYGEVQKIADELGIAVQSIYEYAHVSRQVQILVRTKNLSWSHHKLVAKFDDPADQTKWLTRAEDNGWSVSQMKKAMREDEQQPSRAGQAYKKTLAQIRQIRTSAHEYTPTERAQLIAELRATANALESL